MVNTVVEEYRLQVDRQVASSISGTLKVYEEQRTILMSDLKQARLERDEFLAANSMVALDPESVGQFEIERLNQFRTALDVAERRASELAARVEEAELLRGDLQLLRAFAGGGSGATSGAPVEPEFVKLLEDIGAAEADLERLRDQRREAIRVMKMTPRHEAIVELDGRIAEVAERLARYVGERDGSTSSSVNSSERVEKIFGVLRAQAKAAEEQVVEEQRRVDAQRSVAATGRRPAGRVPQARG